MRKHHTKNKGDLGVVKVQCALVEQGYSVLIPLSEHEPFDLVAYRHGVFKRIQCKYRSVRKGSIEVQFKSSWTDKNGSHHQPMEKSEVDVIAIYCPDTDDCYFVAPAQFDKAVTLRVTTPTNNQNLNINWANDYLRVP
jgi:hypothetical protein